MRQIKRCDSRVRRKCPDAGFCKGVFMEGSECDSLQSKLAEQGDQREARLIDANGSYTLNATDNTGHILCFSGGIISVMDIRGCCVCEFFSDDTPTLDAVEVVHGWWWHCDDDCELWYECSVCSASSPIEANYCPNCGAKMDLEVPHE